MTIARRMGGKARVLASMWERHSSEWRDPKQICSQWKDASDTDPRLFEVSVTPDWWSLLEERRLTLLVTREYEHLFMALAAQTGRAVMSFLSVPHPSGLAIDRSKGRVYLASTRNPNQVVTLRPAIEINPGLAHEKRLMPVSSTNYRGALYLHDLALIGSKLYGNAVGQNSVVHLDGEGNGRPAWWPKCIERAGDPAFDRNHIQLNSIAAGRTLQDSYFSASSEAPGRARPGHLNYPVDGRGVIFSGRSREPICTGLTRPHSARLSGNRIWVANSGYGELGFVENGKLEVVARLPGWTRGLCLVDDIAFVGTSQVIPRYARYAPGLDISMSRCGVHAVSMKSGRLLGSMTWPFGNQIFAIDWISSAQCMGLPFPVGPRRRRREIEFFQHYEIDKVPTRP